VAKRRRGDTARRRMRRANLVANLLGQSPIASKLIHVFFVWSGPMIVA
jgi:hypothetical protein